jgi:hypothetical protein
MENYSRCTNIYMLIIELQKVEILISIVFSFIFMVVSLLLHPHECLKNCWSEKSRYNKWTYWEQRSILCFIK